MSSSIGIMTFLIYGKIKNVPVTTNQISSFLSPNFSVPFPETHRICQEPPPQVVSRRSHRPIATAPNRLNRGAVDAMVQWLLSAPGGLKSSGPGGLKSSESSGRMWLKHGNPWIFFRVGTCISRKSGRFCLLSLPQPWTNSQGWRC